jgi:hypothetical protein
MDQGKKQRILGGSVVLLLFSASLVVSFVYFNHGAFRTAGLILLGCIVGGPFLLRFLIPRAVAVFAPGPVPNVPLDDAARKRILRRIRRLKIWIAVLMIIFPFGIANGAKQHAWLPTLAGAMISLLWMYVSFQQIEFLRKKLENKVDVHLMG